MATVFDRLGYNFDDPDSKVNDYDADTITHLDSMPPFLEDWQSNDIANNNVGSYFTNPLSSPMTSMNTTIQVIKSSLPANGGTTTAISNLFSNIANTCNYLTGYSYNSGTEFVPVIVNVEGEIKKYIDHTNRISGVTPMSSATEDTSTKPFHDSAMGVGRGLSYIVYQTSGVSNSAPALGSFTSLLIGNTINTYITTISTYANTINASVNVSSVSTLSLSTVTTIDTTLSDIRTLIYTRRTHDETFFTNMKTMVSDYQKTRQFSNMGSAETEMLNNYTGTSKILTRINS